jgi:exonuclease SbcD
MKILHTADWHFGKRLYQTDLLEDSRLFVDWLLKKIQELEVDILLVAGDVFDTTNPSSDAMQVYYDFLKGLVATGCRLVITGGNHDSPAVLNAPREILKLLNVQVLGGACENCLDEILPLPDRSGKIGAAVCAVPFLRDRDLKRSVEGESFEDRRLAIRSGLERRYAQQYEEGRRLYPDVPLFGMGHLFMNGSATSDDDEKLHTIGTLDLFEASLFPPFDYLALGHIHRPQKIAKKDTIRYSGSPIALSFSEIKDEKLVVFIETEGKNITRIEELRVPAFRKLERITGTFEEVEARLMAYTRPEGTLKSLAEIEIREEHRDPALADRAKVFFLTFQQGDIQVLNWKFRFSQQLRTADELFGESTALTELTLKDVFDQWLSENAATDESKVLLGEAFHELLNGLN